MTAPKKNAFWKQRTKHGRDKLFASADLLWKAACDYFKWCDSNPWLKTEQLKKPITIKDVKGTRAVTIVEIPTARPYTLSGLCLYLDCSQSYFREFKSNPPQGSEDFLTVITRIEEIIYTQKFEGAAVGVFNANIIARDLGLADKKEINGSVDTTPIDLGRLSDQELDTWIALQEKVRHG
ncbi:DNA-packaging protein [Pontibacter sp. HJ8]